MKGLILAAGWGTRLRPITSLRPKPTIPVANKALIVHAVNNLKEAGINEIGVVVNEQVKGHIQNAVAECEDVSFEYIIQNPPKGLAHAVQVSKSFLQDDSFVMYLGDNLFQRGVKDFVAAFDPNTMNALLALVEVPDPRALGVAVVEDGRITKLVEKPKVPPSNLAVSGVYVFDSSIFDMVDVLEPGAKGEYQITDAIQMLIDSGKKVGYKKVEGWWKDTGKPDDILDANRLLLLDLKSDMNADLDNSLLIGEVAAAKGTIIKNSKIVGPVLIGENCYIENAFIGPYTTIGNEVTLNNAELESSVVGNGTEIKNIKTRLQDSLIGEDVVVSRRIVHPSTHKLVIGDSSIVTIQE